MRTSGPLLYGPLAGWWPLLSAPADYAEEAAFYRRVLEESRVDPLETVLELGSGGGNNASHLKHRFQLTLVDLSPEMLAVSGALNPECEHLQGDMRTARLDREFDAVFVHDAIAYMTRREDLRQVMRTARAHCRPGGAALFAPDHVRETFAPRTSHGGHDGDGRGLRYLEWVWDPDPADTTVIADFAYLLRDADGSVRVVHDRHEFGVFPRGVWIELLEEAGFTHVEVIPFPHSEVEEGLEVFRGRAG
jgi:SAM-dependent methyltransferase